MIMDKVIISETQSLCPECMKRIPARYIEEDNKIYLEKACPQHGSYRALIWRNASFYRRWKKAEVHAERVNGKPSDMGCPYDCGLCEMHEGGTCTAVMEITYRCNMKCGVCFADTENVRSDPDLPGIRNMYEAVRKSGGDCSVQLSGGEPTMREDLEEIIRIGKGMGFSHIQVNSNGLRLATEPDYADKLKNAGADLIYLQFDGIDDAVYRKIRGKDMLALKERAIENCAAAGLGVLLVPVIIPGVNDNQLGDMIEFAKKYMPCVKGVHFQPISYFGRFPGKEPTDEVRIGLGDVMEALVLQTGGEMRLRDMISRKRYDAICAFSSLFFMDENNKLHAITGENREEVSEPVSPSTDFPGRANKYTNRHWRMANHTESVEGAGSGIDDFAKRITEYTLSVTGMGFQDVWNIDLSRLRGCCVHIATSDGNLTPFCAFHLTDAHGRRLYQSGSRGELCRSEFGWLV